MPGRVNLPGAEELFRATGAKPVESAEGAASGRIRHDEKITVYVSSDELIALEDARLTLRRAGIAVDRGRLVRAAIAAGLAELEAKGPQADLVARLGSL
ncbi:MAG: hypothetical protein LBV06_11140 [Propionibacteriaceae bacterium]|jgi:hypothetical protein|nr:hypothetical protein [Propionibacteriaceae bacterium]